MTSSTETVFALAGPDLSEEERACHAQTVEGHLDGGDVARLATLLRVTGTAVLEAVLVNTHALLVRDALQ